MTLQTNTTASGSTALAPSEYGFQGRLARGFPSQVIIEATELCNLACTHCAHPTYKKSNYYSGGSLEPALNDKAIEEVASSAKGLCQYIRYTSEGEPLIHPRIFEMLSFAVQRSGTTVTITTNGTISQGGKLEKLMATGVGIIDVSIDAHTPATYAKIRINGDLEVTRANVQRLIDMSKSPGCKTKVVVSYVEQSENCHETREFENYWRDHGADYVVIRRLHSNAGALVQLAEQMHTDRRPSDRRPCLYPWERIILNPRGHLSFCPNDWSHGSNIIDYRRTTIAETWQGAFYSRLRQAHLSNDYAQHSFCGQCPDWRSTRWPDEGRSYADMVQEFKARE